MVCHLGSPRRIASRLVFVRQIGRFPLTHIGPSRKWPIWARNPLHSAIELISADPCPYFEAIVPNGVLVNSSPPYTAPIAVHVAQRHQMAAAVHGRNPAQMRPSGEIARMAHPTQPVATDRVRGRSRTRISPHPSYSGYIGGSTEFHGLQEAKIGHFGGFRRSGNRFEMR